MAAQAEDNQVEMEEEEGHGGPILIAQLEGQGISAADVKKLIDAGFHTVDAGE
jgi:DNA repair protein RAD51